MNSLCLDETRAYEIITPSEFKVEASNFLKVQLVRGNDDPKPDSVIFYINSVDDEAGINMSTMADESYSAVFNCKLLVDGKYYVKAIVWNNKEATTIGDRLSELGVPIMLDRQPILKSLTFISCFKPRHKELEHFLETCPGQQYISNNNQVYFHSAWDYENLYFKILVKDQYLNWVEPELFYIQNAEVPLQSIWKSDGFEICFDLENNHSEWRMLDDHELLASVNEIHEGNHWDDIKGDFRHWGDEVKIKSEINGTLNDNSDQDSSYMMIVIIPWKAMGYKPVANTEMGFDLQVFDRDASAGNSFRNTWSRNDVRNNDNTSEWGNMILRKKSNQTLYLVLLMLLFILLVGSIFFVVYRVRLRMIERQKKNLEEQVRLRTKELNEKNVVLSEHKEELESQAGQLLEMNARLNERHEELQAALEELRSTTDELYNTNQELFKLNSTKDKFFSIIAHDLKNPFQALTGLSSVLRKAYHNIDENRKIEMIEMIEKSSKAASKLLENLLLWARSQTNRVKFEPRETNLSEIVNETINVLKIHSDKKEQALKSTLDPRINVFADPNMISTVIRNVLNNAIKYTPVGGNIEVEATRNKNQVEILVKDNGVGIPPEKIKNLFKIDVEQSTKGTQGEAGTGLGLIICKEFVEQNNGKIEVQSQVDKGTTFIIQLPAPKPKP